MKETEKIEAIIEDVVIAPNKVQPIIGILILTISYK